MDPAPSQAVITRARPVRHFWAHNDVVIADNWCRYCCIT